MSRKPSIKRLREHLQYVPSTGDIFWIKTKGSQAVAGKAAGSPNTGGYRQIGFDGKYIHSHIVAWALHYGYWPKRQVEHRNTVRHDNRIKNLRLATSAENARNRRTRRDNLTGLKGVSPSGRKFRARIMLDGESRFLGVFSTAAAAHAAYCAAAVRLHGQFANNGAV